MCLLLRPVASRSLGYRHEKHEATHDQNRPDRDDCQHPRDDREGDTNDPMSSPGNQSEANRERAVGDVCAGRVPHLAGPSAGFLHTFLLWALGICKGGPGPRRLCAGILPSFAKQTPDRRRGGASAYAFPHLFGHGARTGDRTHFVALALAEEHPPATPPCCEQRDTASHPVCALVMFPVGALHARCWRLSHAPSSVRPVPGFLRALPITGISTVLGAELPLRALTKRPPPHRTRAPELWRPRVRSGNIVDPPGRPAAAAPVRASRAG